jgi:hypothetical protein
VRPHGQTKLGFFPLPVAEAKRLKTWLTFPERFSALDPCAGDGVAFTHLLHGVNAHRYGIEIDAYRTEQARALGIETLQANTMDVRCPPEAVSLLYLNPPYDWESGDKSHGVNEVRLTQGHIVREGLHTTWCELRLRKNSPSSRKRWLSLCGRPSLFTVGRERAKLGYFWRHAYGVPHSIRWLRREFRHGQAGDRRRQPINRG